MKRPHAVSERRPNPWVGVIGLVGYVVVAAGVTVLLWLAVVLLIVSLGPRP